MTPHIVKIDQVEVGVNSPSRIMGVINLSPESFYSRSVVTSKEQIHKAVKRMENDGVDIIDVGGASTAPESVYGTQKVSEKDELQRVKDGLDIILDSASVPVSIDTTSSKIAEFALDSGAALVNDISGLRADSKMAKVVAERDIPVVLMSLCEKPCAIIQQSLNALSESLELAHAAGIANERIIVDPGIGFGKPREADFELIRHLKRFTMWGHPVLVGVSRKAFIGDLLAQTNPNDRLTGTIGVTSIVVARGASIIRTHDIMEARQAASVGEKLRNWTRETEHDIDLLGIIDERTAEIVIEQIGTGADIRRALSRKAVTLSLLLQNIKTPAALIIKQEILALGGDAAYHRDVIDSGVERTDVLVMATPLQLERLTGKLLRMDYFGLRKVGRAIRSLIEKREKKLG
ncbi:MAG: dihydropteroate synthase [Candidatus Thorarchaeota archaeon]